ncbi:MAG TPA: chemotaxis protein CheD [Coriobacteriia bacterium]
MSELTDAARDMVLLEDPDRIIVGVGEIDCAFEPRILITQALGSCVGVALWDPRVRVGGLAHVMLPTALGSAQTGRRHRFADIAVPALVERMVDLGAGRRRMVAKLAGGASMFRGESGTDTIGDRNVAAVRDQLERAGVPVSAADTGGSHARTIELSPGTGILLIRSYTYGMHEI